MSAASSATSPASAKLDDGSDAASYVELCREYRFEAAHRLPKVPPGHRCARLHGHSYKIEVFVFGPVDPETEWLIDFYDLDAAVAPIVDALDHRTLNEIDGLDNPTCERLCRWIWTRLAPSLPVLRAVTVWETIDARCTYYGPQGPRAPQGTGDRR